MRIAFITPEFVTEPDTFFGGLSNYLSRMVTAIQLCGHQAEVFVSSSQTPGTLDWQGTPVHRVAPGPAPALSRTMGRLTQLLGIRRYQLLERRLGVARALADALNNRERDVSFDLVQSSDYEAVGWYVPRRSNRPHIVRCSSVGDLLYSEAGRDKTETRALANHERRVVGRADAAYAPSRFVQTHLRERFGIDVDLVRPPALCEVEPAESLNFLEQELPQRFMLYFGKLVGFKGIDVLAHALPIVCSEAPDFRMVFAGGCEAALWQQMVDQWGPHAKQASWLGQLQKPQLYVVLKRAEAAVLPSRVDNLPNTVIESLMFGVPVIGPQGVSFDEAVEENVTGHLVPMEDHEALAAAMLRIWRGETPVRKGFTWDSELARAMKPRQAVANLFALAGIKT